MMVFATAGMVIIGLGIILLFAYNWDDLSKGAKLLLIFGAMIAAHAGGLAMLRRGGWHARFGEALVVLGTMFYGAGIWLVAQIYNIHEHYPNGFLFWALGALAMAWALRSTAQGILATLLIVTWSLCETTGFERAGPGSLVLLTAGWVPLAWKNRSALLLTFVLVGLQVVLVFNIGAAGGGGQAFTSSLTLGVLLVAVARGVDWRSHDFESGGIVTAFIGFLSFLICAYILTFESAVHDVLNWASAGPRPDFAFICSWTIFGLALLAWILVGVRSVQGRPSRVRREDWLLPIALLHCVSVAAFSLSSLEFFTAWAFNLVLLGIALMWMWRGCQETRMRPTLFGFLLLAAVVLARYFDLFESLASRGAAFIVLGVIFVAEALYYRKVRRETEGRA